MTIQLSASAVVLGLLVGPRQDHGSLHHFLLAGVLLGSNQAALLAMVVNVGAYGTEIVRAGIESSISRGPIEAGLALGLRPLRVLRYVIQFRALSTAYPAEQPFVLLMLGSSVVSTFRRRNSPRLRTTRRPAPSAI